MRPIGVLATSLGLFSREERSSLEDDEDVGKFVERVAMLEMERMRRALKGFSVSGLRKHSG